MHAVPKAHLQREQVRHWSWIWAAVTAALQAQAQNFMHWTALGFGLGIAAYFAVSREPVVAVFWAVSLSAGLCAVFAVRLRNGIARLLIVIAVAAAGFSWSQYRAYSVSGPVLSERFYGAVQGRVIGIDRSLSEKPRLTLDQLVLGALPQYVTPNRLRVALHGSAQESLPQIGDIVQLAAHFNTLPHYGILANVIAVPIMGFSGRVACGFWHVFLPA